MKARYNNETQCNNTKKINLMGSHMLKTYNVIHNAKKSFSLNISQYTKIYHKSEAQRFDKRFFNI